ncbi:hypothetical protein MASR1M32_02050 [Rhodobacter sp.]
MTATFGRGRARAVITLKSSDLWPPVPLAVTATSPGKATGTRGVQVRSIPSPVRRKPGPVSTVRLRFSPGKIENGPSSTTAARDRRTRRVPSRSSRHNSVVVPLPFFQGWTV